VFCCRAATHPDTTVFDFRLSRRSYRLNKLCASLSRAAIRDEFPGDLFCHVVVETPVNLTERQRQLLREFESTTAQDSARHNPRAKGWFDKVKEFFEG
jgi:hypothetical protein